NVSALLDRGFITLEDEDYEKADGIFEEVLNQNPRCAKAYMGKLLAYYEIKNANDFAKIIVEEIFLDRKNTKTLEPEFDVNLVTRERYIGEGTLEDVVFEEITKAFKEEYLTCLDFLEKYNPELDYVEEYCKLNDNDYKESVDYKLYARYLKYVTDEDKESFDYKKLIGKVVKDETEKEEKRVNDLITKYKSKISLENINKTIDDANKKIKDEVDKNGIVDFDSLEKEYKSKLSKWKVEFDEINNAYEAECERTKTHWPEVREERIKKWEAECERIQKEYDEYQKEVNEVNEQNNKLKDAYNKQLAAYNTEITNIETQIQTLMERKGKLSIFKKKEKEEIDNNINILSNRKFNINKPTLNLKPIPNKRPVELPPKPEYSETPIMPEKPEMPSRPKRDYINNIDIEMIYIDEFIIKKIVSEQVKNKIKVSRVELLDDDHIKFGHYHGENLTWRVLKRNNNKVLIITNKVIDVIPYNKEWGDITWSECTLRKYLNNDFINTSFSSSIIKQIETVTLKNPDNKILGTKGGPDTQDRVFCLSMDEAETYFKDDNDRVAKPTDYAISRAKEDKLKSFLDDKTGGGKYWLRTPGSGQYYAALVRGSGNADFSGNYVVSASGGIRPALWLRLDY
nr:DUF6273 domain-containing protein [Lachnospiraceae bacterium]